MADTRDLVMDKDNKVGPLLKQQGQVVLIRTAVYHAIGTIVGLYDVGGVAFVRLSEASYLGDTGRFHEATTRPIHEVTDAEIEPVGGEGVMDIQVAMICDVTRAQPYRREQK